MNVFPWSWAGTLQGTGVNEPKSVKPDVIRAAVGYPSSY